jgi:nitroreductase/NAD-dependent dihydropyrimidine dehydrogenase PreA subunit
MDIFTIKQDTCNQCGICADVCHLGIIDFQEENYPKPFPEVTEKMCSKCGACLVFCPTDSFIHRDIPLEHCPPIDDSLLINYNQSTQLIKARRSIRDYKDTPVPRKDIEQIIDSARYAPTGGNLQNVQWLVFDNREVVEQFRTAGSEFLKQLTAIPGFAPLKDIWDKRRESGIDDLMHGAPVIVATYSQKDIMGAEANALIALAYFDVVATTMGLGCCWDGFFTAAANNFPSIKEVIALPEDHVIHEALAVGYPKYKRYRIPQRNPAQITWQ